MELKGKMSSLTDFRLSILLIASVHTIYKVAQ